VRDELLGGGGGDRDWVVVGATPEQMLAEGYTQVGRDFPVFLHPETHEEYALARTERKSGSGHLGFVCHTGPEVTLRDDLLRRDLTINAIAKDVKGELIDPFEGVRDLRAGVLRHVSPAFAEDPLRILRIARFAATLGFVLAPETETLLRSMTAAGALVELSAERVWQELHKTLKQSDGATFVALLRSIDAIEPWFAELNAVADPVHLVGNTVLQRFASLGLLLDNAALQRFCERLRAPTRYERLAQMVIEDGVRLHAWQDTPAADVLSALSRAGVLQRRGGVKNRGGVKKHTNPRHADFVALLELLTLTLGDFEQAGLLRLVDQLPEISAASVACDGLSGPQLGAAIAAERVRVIGQAQ